MIGYKGIKSNGSSDSSSAVGDFLFAGTSGIHFITLVTKFMHYEILVAEDRARYFFVGRSGKR